MEKANKSKLFIGLVCIVAAFVCALALLFFVGQAGRTRDAAIASLEVQLANLIAEQGDQFLSSSDANRVRRAPVQLDDLLTKAEQIYGAEERNRSEGVLWVDRKDAVYLITLGAVHGLQQGSSLSIYENDTKIGEVSVANPLDVISYVTPVGLTLADFDSNYYRVVILERS